jgi:hypothetical protein
MKEDRLLEIRGLAKMGLEGSVAGEELKEIVEYVDELRLHLFRAISISEQRGYRLEEEGESLGDPEEVQLTVARATLYGTSS